jgi:hypothetical protein
MSRAEYLRVLERRRDHLARRVAAEKRTGESYDRAELAALNWILGRFRAEYQPEQGKNA